MTRSEAVALIQMQLAQRSDLESQIVSQLQFAQFTLERAPEKPWFLVSEDTFAPLTVDEPRLATPDDFLAEVDEATFKYRPDDWPTSQEVDLRKDEYDVLAREFRGADAGEPVAYALLGDYFHFFPTPDDTYQVRLIYYQKDDVLTTDIENRWLRNAPLLLMGSAGQLIAGGPIRDKDATAIFSQWIATGLQLVRDENTVRELNNRELQMGGRHY